MDELGPSVLTELHINKEKEQKTYCGASMTVLVKIAFFTLMVKNFADMVQKEQTYITTVEKTMQANTTGDEDGQVKYPL